jgi:peptidoglycan endopeptidase LytE
MKRILLGILLCGVLATTAVSQSAETPKAASSDAGNFLQGVKTAIERNLGRPYVWGAAGMKSFDCSGFVWRVLYENGVLMKRTTARKYYMMLKPVPKSEQWNFGTLVFFDDLKHIGIVDSPTAFYHAQVSAGTNRSPMNSFWRPKVYGFRQLPTRSQQANDPR